MNKIKEIQNQLNKLTQEQKKIIYIGLMLLFFLFSFIRFIYGPQSRKFVSIKKDLAKVESQIAEIEKITAGKDLNQAVKDLKSGLLWVSSKLPDRDDVVVYQLSENAKKLNMVVRNITPAARLPLEDKVGGYDIAELPVTLSLSGNFRALGEYLNILGNSLPVLIRVRQLEIKGKGEGQASLDIALLVSAYLSKEK